ncbi:hypothetical protein DFH06DRAFT_1430012 [Mycena polygramma]|nr:hypothetical protein DFH06DRAFT_1430012 [Mycena polygramma]
MTVGRWEPFGSRPIAPWMRAGGWWEEKAGGERRRRVVRGEGGTGPEGGSSGRGSIRVLGDYFANLVSGTDFGTRGCEGREREQGREGVEAASEGKDEVEMEVRMKILLVRFATLRDPERGDSRFVWRRGSDSAFETRTDGLWTSEVRAGVRLRDKESGRGDEADARVGKEGDESERLKDEISVGEGGGDTKELDTHLVGGCVGPLRRRPQTGKIEAQPDLATYESMRECVCGLYVIQAYMLEAARSELEGAIGRYYFYYFYNKQIFAHLTHRSGGGTLRSLAKSVGYTATFSSKDHRSGGEHSKAVLDVGRLDTDARTLSPTSTRVMSRRDFPMASVPAPK